MKKLFVLTYMLLISIAAFSQTFKEQLLGSISISTFFAALFFALIGVAISLLVHATGRDHASESTPVQFSWRFLLRDNWKRVMLSLLLILVTIRFCKEVTGLELNMFAALGIGIGFDKIAEFVKSKTAFLDVNRNQQTTSQPQTP